MYRTECDSDIKETEFHFLFFLHNISLFRNILLSRLFQILLLLFYYYHILFMFHLLFISFSLNPFEIFYITSLLMNLMFFYIYYFQKKCWTIKYYILYIIQKYLVYVIIANCYNGKLVFYYCHLY